MFKWKWILYTKYKYGYFKRMLCFYVKWKCWKNTLVFRLRHRTNTSQKYYIRGIFRANFSAPNIEIHTQTLILNTVNGSRKWQHEHCQTSGQKNVNSHCTFVRCETDLEFCGWISFTFTFHRSHHNLAGLYCVLGHSFVFIHCCSCTISSYVDIISFRSVLLNP